MEAEKMQDPEAEVRQPDDYTRKMDAIAQRDEAETALAKQVADEVFPFSDGQPFDLERITAFMLQVGEHELASKVALGRGLIFAKAYLKHGEFIQWIEERLWFAERTAREYMFIATRIPRGSLAYFSKVGLRKSYVLLQEAGEEELKKLTEGEGIKGLTPERIEGFTAAQLRIAFRRLKEQNRRKQDQIDEGQEQLAKLQKKIDEKAEVNKDYAMACRKVFNYQLGMEQCIVPMLEMFNAKDALPQTKRAVWSLFNELAARFAYEADLIGVEAGEAVPELELTYSEERFRNNLSDLEAVYAEGGLNIGEEKTETGEGRTEEEAARVAAKADIEIEDAEFVDEETGEILS